MEGELPLVTRKTLTWRFALGILRTGYGLFWRRQVIGHENVPREGPVILVGNHQSFLDIPLMAIAVDHRHVAFAARRSLIDNPFLRFIFARVGVILVDPSRGDRATLRRMIEHVEAGDALGIFPEGTRSLDGELSEPKKGALLVARTTGAPIIPCAISGTREAWPRGGRWPRPGKVCIEFAAAVDGSRPDALDVAWQSIAAMLSKPSEPDFEASDQATHNNP